MNRLNINAIALAVGFMFGGAAIAQGLTKNEYEAGKQRIEADHRAARANCSSLAGNPKDVCLLEARGSEQIARAQLDADFKPTPTTRYKVRVARAEASFAVAKEQCDEAAGNTKDVCLKEADAAQTVAMADAKAQMKSADALATANERSADARRTASDDKLDARYGVAKEKCDVYAGGAKDVCLGRAKTRFGKS